MKRLFLALFLLFSPTVCFGYVFGGAIYDENNLYINGASVTLLTANTLNSPLVTTTTIFGNYSFPDVEEGLYTLLISGSNFPVNSWNVSVSGDSSFNNYNIYTSASMENLTITVSDGTAPINLANIYISSNSLFYAYTTTNQLGEATIFNLPTNQKYTVTVSADGYFPSVTVPNFTNFAATIQVSDTVSLYGTVTDSQSSPIEGVAVNLYYNQQSIHQMSTDSTGSYSFDVSAGSLYGVNFYKNLYEELTVFQTAFLHLPNIVSPTLFPVGGILTGTVFSSIDALPLAGAAVVLSQENNTTISFTTSANGEFTFLNVPSGLNILNVNKPNFSTETAAINLKQSAVGSINFTISPTSSTINGNVFASGEPIAGVYSVYQENFPLLNGLTFQDGSFSINTLEAGTYIICVDASLYQTSYQEVVLASGEQLNLNFNLSLNPVILSGEVRDASTQPITGAILNAFQDGKPIGITYTNTSGLYTFSNLPLGLVHVRAKDMSYQDQLKHFNFTQGGDQTEDFSLAALPNTLNVGIYDMLTNYPLQYALVTLSDASDYFISGFGTNIGAYQFSGLSSGTYSYSALLAGYISNTSAPITFSENSETLSVLMGLYPQDVPARNISGATLINNYGAGVVEKVYQINWESSISAAVVSYNVYKNGAFLGNVLSTDRLQFNDSSQTKNSSTVYSVKSVNSDGSLSSSVEVILQ